MAGVCIRKEDVIVADHQSAERILEFDVNQWGLKPDLRMLKRFRDRVMKEAARNIFASCWNYWMKVT
ncbi:MAG: hypothetical protein WCK35_22440 [Chloroflexota bacterium]